MSSCMDGRFDLDLAQKVLHLIDEQISSADQHKVIDYQPPQSLIKQLNLSLAEAPQDPQRLLAHIKTYIQHTVKTHHPYFFNQLWSGFSFPSFLADMITTAFNTSMYTYETAPIATLIEQKMIQACLDLAQFTNGEGIFTTGGSASNLSALLAARNHLDASIARQGYKDHKLKLFISQDAHYSFAKAANVIGLGMDNIVKIKTLDNGKMNIEHLQQSIEHCLKQNEQPFFISATAGTTVRGTYDPIDAIADIAERYKLWLHVDGAWGASALWHQEHKQLLSGLERADSLAWDAHKMLGIPLMCAMLLFKEKGMLATAHQHGAADEYIFREHEASYNLGPISIQCGRKVDALKLYLTWQSLGHQGLHEHIDKLFKQAQFFAQAVAKHSQLKLFGPVESLNVCFQYYDADLTPAQINALNLEIRTRLLHSGQAMINYAYIGNNLIIRLILANPSASHDHLSRLLEMIVQTGDNLKKETDHA